MGSPPGFVYFVHSEPSGLTKIGWSENPERRIWELRATCRDKEPLVLLGNVQGDKELEASYHQAFADRRIEGEWFRDLPALESGELRPEVVRAVAAAGRAERMKEVEDALRAVRDAEAALYAHMRAIPKGPKRRKAMLACLASGMSRADVAKTLGVSRQRVTQLLS